MFSREEEIKRYKKYNTWESILKHITHELESWYVLVLIKNSYEYRLVKFPCDEFWYVSVYEIKVQELTNDVPPIDELVKPTTWSYKKYRVTKPLETMYLSSKDRYEQTRHILLREWEEVNPWDVLDNYSIKELQKKCHDIIKKRDEDMEKNWL